MNIALVCHSVGDSSFVIPTAQRLADESKANTITILVAGKAAKIKIESEKFSTKINILYLDAILNTSFSEFENTALTPEQLSRLQAELKGLDITHAIIGTPSSNNSEGSYQIAQLLAKSISAGYIYNDYLFDEEKHIGWKKLQEEHWPELYQWLLPLSAAMQKVNQLNPKLSTEVIGHAALASAINSKALPTSRQFLQEEEKHKLVFVSGGKNITEDLLLLTAMITVLQTEDLDHIDIRIGLHPGIDNVNSYLQLMLLHLLQYPVKNNIQIIVDPSMQKRIDLESIRKNIGKELQKNEQEFTKNLDNFLRFVNVSGDQAAATADGVVNFTPATLLGKSVVLGKPSICYQGKPFLSADNLLVGPSNFSRFFKQINENKTTNPLSNKEYKLHPVDQIIAKFQ